MIKSCIHRRILHHVFKEIYVLAGYFYKVLKFLLRPLIYLHPRVYRFAIAVRDAVKELIRPSEVTPNITGEVLNLNCEQNKKAQNEELSFWDNELSLKGHYAEYTKRRIDPEQRKEEFPSSLFEPLMPLLEQKFPNSKPFKVIELGSGPISSLAYGVDKGLIEVTAVDILADEYKALYEKYGLLDFPIKPIQGRGETLAELFQKESFHCAHIRNALDHTQDIVRSFNNVVSLVKRNGYIILLHSVREGSLQKWSESHRWDLELTVNGLVAFNREGQEFQLQRNCNLEFSHVSYSSVELERWLDIVFKRV